MRTCTLALLLFVLFAVGRGESAEETPEESGLRPISEADNVFAIVFHPIGRRISEPRVIVVAWADGQIVWSDDLVEGGPPYRTAKVGPERVDAVLKQIKRDGAFDIESLNNVQYGFDASYTSILAKHDDGSLKMGSWHEAYEADSRVIATSTGLRPLGEQKKWEVLAKEPSEYLLYRLIWSELRRNAQALIPVEGEPADGKAVMRRGEIFWQE